MSETSPTAPSLELVLFAAEPEQVRQGLAAGVQSMIVDLEWRGKEERQRQAQTEINRDRPEHLETLRVHAVPGRYCRLNRFGHWTAAEVEAVLAAGATCLLLPMVQALQEVDTTLDLIGGRCGLGILVETPQAVEQARLLAERPLDRVYVGLNDLAIARGSDRIFEVLADGTVESLRQQFAHCCFGFGGVTVVDGGDPVPSRLLLAEMARLGCSFSFLRRSFKRDVEGRDAAHEVVRIQELWRELRRRSEADVSRDRATLLAILSHGR